MIYIIQFNFCLFHQIWQLRCIYSEFHILNFVSGCKVFELDLRSIGKHSVKICRQQIFIFNFATQRICLATHNYLMEMATISLFMPSWQYNFVLKSWSSSYFWVADMHWTAWLIFRLIWKPICLFIAIYVSSGNPTDHIGSHYEFGTLKQIVMVGFSFNHLSLLSLSIHL